ncbi:MAG: hypothetical protein AAFQ94_21045 [Bacteroidota bacterium]
MKYLFSINKALIISFLSISIFMINLSAIVAQEKLDGIWYAKSYDGQLSNRVVIKGKSVVYERYESYQVDEPYWKVEKEMQVDKFKTIAKGFVIARFVNNTYYGGEFTLGSNPDELTVFRMNDGNSQFDQLLTEIAKYPMKKYFSRQYYSEERLKEIQKYPSLDQITKEHVIELISHMIAEEQNMEPYAGKDRLIGNIGRSMLDQKMLSMGFDPHKPSENGYFMKRFAEDADVKKLLGELKYFVLY